MAINRLHIAVIGCGLIGKRRAAEVFKDREAKLLYVVDINRSYAEALANEFGSLSESDYRVAIADPNVDAIIISTPNHLLAEIAIAALNQNKHVLIEKPLGRNVAEARAILDAATSVPHFLVVKTGFNHRFHPALAKAKELFDVGSIGDLLSIRARYGHGGRPGMEREWRASKELCGGGELLDQGVHVIDLIQWFGGDIVQLFGQAKTKFWNMEVEDNAYVIAKTNRDVHAIFHVSWTNWRNIFSFELMGSQGYLNINGLGGSYGPETLEFGVRNPKGGRPDISHFEFPGADMSWELEWIEFKRAIQEKREPIGNGDDGWKANLVIDAIMRSERARKFVDVYEPSPLLR